MIRCLFFSVSFLLISFVSIGQGLQSYNSADSYGGYTLFPNGQNAYLIDNCGQLVQQWATDDRASLSCFLMHDGRLLWPSWLDNNNTFNGGGGHGGRLDIYDSNGLAWRHDYYVPNGYAAHHDVQPLPNGNFLVIAWEEISVSTALALGRNPALLGNELWSERIVEIEPVGNSTANIVWEWKFIDHIIQEFDSTKPSYGLAKENPQLFDFNTASGGNDWLHMNGIEYIEEFDQILFSCRHVDEIFIIDHSTTTAEAAGHTGGNYDKGGDILYRYGNPANYDRGANQDQVLYGQHDARWIPATCTEPARISIFNNLGGANIGVGQTATADIIYPPVDEFGNYAEPLSIDDPYEPTYPDIIFSNGPGGSFAANNQGGCQLLPNNNMLVCEPNSRNFFELDESQNVVWEYQAAAVGGSVFKVVRYNEDFPGLANLDLTPQGTIENPPSNASTNCTVSWPPACNLTSSFSGLPTTVSSSAPIALSGLPAGGSFSGTGVVFNAFNPSVAGPGIHEITYTYSDGFGCEVCTTQSVLVFAINYNFVNYNLGTITPKLNQIDVNIEVWESDKYQIMIYSTDGKLMKNEQIELFEGSRLYSIETGDLPKGTYVLNIFNQQNRITEKFVQF